MGAGQLLRAFPPLSTVSREGFIYPVVLGIGCVSPATWVTLPGWEHDFTSGVDGGKLERSGSQRKPGTVVRIREKEGRGANISTYPTFTHSSMGLDSPAVISTFSVWNVFVNIFSFSHS